MLDVFPSAAFQQIVNCGGGDAVSHCQRINALTRSVTRSDLFHLFGIQLRAITIAVATLGQHVLRIIVTSAAKQMRRITAEPTVAMMTDQKSLRNRTTSVASKRISNAVRLRDPTPEPRAPIPLGASGAEPRPTQFLATRTINVAPKSLGECAHIHFRHILSTPPQFAR